MQQSRVGQKLSDIITLRVVIGILALLLIVPSFNITSNLYGTPSHLVDGGLAMLTVSYAAVWARPLAPPRQRIHQPVPVSLAAPLPRMLRPCMRRWSACAPEAGPADKLADREQALPLLPAGCCVGGCALLLVLDS